MQSNATHPHHYVTRTIRAYAGLFALALLLFCTSQAAMAQDARVVSLQNDLNRLEQTVRQAKEAYYANPTRQALESAMRAYKAYETAAETFRDAVGQTEAGKTAQSGGPDGFGYTYVDSSEPGGPTFDFTSISGTAGATMCTSGVGCGADDGGTLAGLGFTFNFYGVDYATTWVASNGYLNPSGDNVFDFTQDCPITASTVPNETIASLWDDLSPNNSVAGGVWYGSFASCPTGSYSGGACFVAEWDDVPEFVSTGSNTFQSILYPDGTIENQYESLTGVDGTSGIKGQGGTVGLTYRCGAAPPVASNSAVRFIPPDPTKADLEVIKTVNDTAPEVGDVITYTITLKNFGGGNAVVRVNDLLAAGLSFDSYTATQGTYNAGNGDWQVGTLNAGGTATLTIDAEVEEAGTIRNTAFVAFSNLVDPDPSNNTDFVDINPVAADLALTKQVIDFSNEDGVLFVEFMVRVVNQGPNNTCGVEVEDVLSPDMTLLGVSTSQGLVVATPPVIGWGVGCVTVGSSATLNVRVSVPENGNLVNTAEVTGSDLPDPDSEPGDGEGDDFALATAGPRTLPDFVPEGGPGGIINRGDRFTADLKTDKTADVSSAPVGGTVKYTVEVTNQGPQSTANVEVTDHLPECLTDVTWSANRGAYDGWVWDIGKLKVGEVVTLLVTATVGPTCTGTVTNTAEVTQSSLPDPDDQFNLFDEEPVQDEISSASFDVDARANGRQLDGSTFALGNNYPNPFNPVTVLPFSVPEASYVSIKVYDLLGRSVATLVDGPMAEGVHEVRFEASLLPTGTYLVRMEAADKVFTQRITLMK